VDSGDAVYNPFFFDKRYHEKGTRERENADDLTLDKLQELLLKGPGASNPVASTLILLSLSLFFFSFFFFVNRNVSIHFFQEDVI